MEKRIIAVLCVLTLLVTAFAACGKKKSIININGRDYLAVTDDAGSTVVNDSGDVVVYVTDKDGEILTHENGEKQTNAVGFPNKVVGKHTFETPLYKLNMPENWELNDENLFIRDGNKDVNFAIMEGATLNESITLQTYIDIQVQGIEELIAIDPQYQGKLIYDVQDGGTITEKELPCVVLRMQLLDDNKTTVSEQYLYYINFGSYMVKASYICTDAASVGSFDGLSFLDENLVVKKTG